MANINGTDNDDVIRTAAAGGSLGGLPDATDTGDTIATGGGNDTIIAGAGDDVIDPGPGDDTVNGGDGNDLVVSGPGVDSLDGGAGIDYLDFGSAPGGVAVHLGQGDVFEDGYGNREYAYNFEIVYGSPHDDWLAGGPGFNVLFGLGGNDEVYGNLDNDILYGGVGDDVLVGEEGPDTLYGEWDNDLLVGGRNDIVGPSGQRADDFETDELHGGDGNDTLVIGVGDIGWGEEGDDHFEFAIDANTPLDQQPLAVGTAAFSGNRADYDIYIDNGRLIVEDLVGGGGRDDVGSANLTPGGGPQIAAFLRFDDITIDVLNDIPGLGLNQAPVAQSITLTMDAGTGIGTSIYVYDPEGDWFWFFGYTGPSNGAVSDLSFDPFSQRMSFSYTPDAGFVGTDSFDLLFQDAQGAIGSGTITVNVEFDSAVVDVFTVGVGRAFAGNVGLNDADVNGDRPTGFALVDPVPANAADFVFDTATGALSLRQATPQAESMVFSYRADFPDGTSNTAPIIVNFVELDETLVGDSGDNTIFGYGGNDVIEALAGNDTLNGGAGDDLLIPGPGNDILIGGAGFDRAMFSGLISGFQITQVGFDVTVTDIDPSDGDEGTNTITGVELLLFASGQIPGQIYDVLANYDPLSGTIDGRLLNTLGGTRGFGENILNRNDDSSSAAISLTGLFGAPLNFYGQPITQVFVNNNGNLTFTQANGSFSPQPLGVSTPYAIIAGVWADLDTRYGNVTPSPGGNSTGSNLVYWDLDAATQTFTATWDDVSYYSNGSFAGVAFQLQLVGRGGNGDFDIIYRYEHVDGSRAARAGFANQNDTAIYELPGSGTTAVGNLDTAPGNTGLPGVWIFSVRQGAFTPTAAPDSYTTDEDTPLVVSGPGVLGNDADPLARPLTAVLYSNPTRGSVALNADGSFTYTPNADFNGTDSFQYQVATGQLASGPTTVTITVNGQNDAPRNIFISGNTTPENLVSGVNTGTGVAVGTLFAFDPESPIDQLGFSLLDNAGGRFVLDGRVVKTAGVLDYETASFHDIVVRVTDPQGAFTDQSIRIFVQNVNEGPSDIFLTGTQAIYENLPPGVLIGTLSSNDAEGDPITYTRLSGPVNIIGDQVFTSISFDYEFQTQFTFRVRAAEPGGDGVERSFTIFVDNLNEAPTAANDLALTVAEAPVTIDVLGNDFDPDGMAGVSVVAVGQGGAGTVQIGLFGSSVTYTPDVGFVGTDSFTYTIEDTGGLQSTATVTVEVRPGDVFAVDDYYFTTEEQPIFFTVTSNDYLLLPDGTHVNVPLEAVLWSLPQHGSLVPYGGTPGQLAYYPDRDFYGTDSFLYVARDQYSSSFFPAMVTIDVTNVNDDPYQTYIPEFLAVENRPLYGTFGGFSFIYDADRFYPADIIRNYVGTISSTNGGTVVLRANGEFDYTPPNGFTGYDSFELTYNDYSYDFWVGQWVANGGPHQAIIRINVEGEEPVAVDDRYTTYVGQTVYGGVLFNDRSPPGLNPLTADQAGGSIQILPNGNFTFVAQHAGTFVSTYYAVDSAGVRSIDPAILKITVLPDPPPPPPPGGGGGGAWGDPHLISHDGLYYDMQGWGEFVLTRATSGETFEVQIRTRAWVPGAQVTIVEAVAAAIDTHRIMAHIDGRLFVDGVATTLEAGTDPLLLSGNVRLYRTDASTYVFVDSDTGEQVRIEGVGSNNYMNVRPSIAPSRANAMEGILGDYDGSNANDIQLRDGTVLSQPVNIYDLYGLYAHDWRVSNAESLFVYAPGESTDDFQLLNFPPVPLNLANLPTALVAAAAAQVAAAGITDPFLAQAAILDLLLTGDEGFIQGAQGADNPNDGLDVFVPPAPPLIGLVSPLAAVAEGDAGTTTQLTFTVFRTGNAADAVSVDWAVQANGLGFTDAADHGGVLPSGTVTLDIGETEKSFTVTVSGDATPELNEIVRIALTATPAGYVLASGTAQGTVLNDDGPVLPDAIDDSVTTTAGTPVVIAPLANDIDPIGAGLSVSGVGAAANGTVQLTGNQVTYTPNPGFSGQDSFTYAVLLAGAGAGTDTATISVQVAPPAPPPNTPPVAGTDAANATAGVELAILPGQLLANDSDADNNPLGVAGIIQGPQNGTAQYISGSGVILYTANAGFTGVDTIIYALSDGQATTPGIINITVGAPASGNRPPVALPDGFIGAEDTQIAGNVLANDSDPDGDPLTAALVSGVSHGIVVLNPDGSFTYTPAPDYFGADSFTYRANDGTENGNIATVALTVTPVNDAPVAQDDGFVTDEDAPLVGNVLLNDSDIDSPTLIAALVAGPAHGYLVLNGDGSFLYLPDADFNGQDSFTYRASDGSLESNTATVTITINPVNDAPVNLQLTNSSVAEDAAIGTVVGLLSATDVDGDALTYAIQGVSGPFTIVGNQLRVAGLLDFEAVPSYGLTLLATDPSGASTQLVATITITDVPEQPVGDLGFRFSNGSLGAGVAQAPPLVFSGYEVTRSGSRTLVENPGIWDAIKNVASPLGGWSPALGSEITIANFVDARMDFGNAGAQDLDLTFVGVKRGLAYTAAGDDRIEVNFHSNGGTFRETFVVGSGAGDDVIIARTVVGSLLDELYLGDNANPANGRLWNPNYDGHLSVLQVDAGDGDDVVIATDVRLVANGGEGTDLLRGGIRDDDLSGGSGNDVIYGGAGNDRIDGGIGSDLLYGEAGDDTILGGDGDDRISGGAGNDTIDGGAGRDNIQGGDGDDIIAGGDGDDVLLGQAGSDRINGGAGNDFIDGGDGDDVLEGGAGNDVIIGGAGNDRIKGGTGQDYLTGGVGQDIFILANQAADRDWITDFRAGEDLLEIEAALFGAGLAPGALDPGRLVVGANPVATTPGVGQFLFNTSNGTLRWDADGAGGAAPQVIVTLTGVGSLSATDFIIV